MERPERIVLFMIGAFTNRMAGRAVGDPRAVDLHRRRPDHPDLSRAARAARGGRMKRAATLPGRVLWNAFFWTYDRATWQYDVMVIAILAFVWLTPPDWLRRSHGARLRPDRVARQNRSMLNDECSMEEFSLEHWTLNIELT